MSFDETLGFGSVMRLLAFSDTLSYATVYTHPSVHQTRRLTRPTGQCCCGIITRCPDGSGIRSGSISFVYVEVRLSLRTGSLMAISTVIDGQK